MTFKQKQKNIQMLLNSFGKLKEDAFDFNLIEKYFRKKDSSGSFYVLSDKTCNDLDFNELFMYVDRTNSKVGQQYLYSKLRTIPSDLEHIIENEKLINYFRNNQDFRLSVQKQLRKLNNVESFYIVPLRKLSNFTK